MKIPPRLLFLPVSRFRTFAEAAWASNLVQTLHARREGGEPDPDCLFRLEDHELPTEARQQELRQMVEDEVARDTLWREKQE